MLSIAMSRKVAAQFLSFALMLSTTFMVWKCFSIITDTSSPIVVVLTGSMEPAFQRGDLLFLYNRDTVSDPAVGDIVVYNVEGNPMTIVHRIVGKWGGNDTKFLTKGDNNYANDVGLYAKGQFYLGREHIVGKVVGYLPFVGYVTIVLSDYPWLKLVVFGAMGLMATIRGR